MTHRHANENDAADPSCADGPDIDTGSRGTALPRLPRREGRTAAARAGRR